ncbi:MAG: hypothetical protein KF746_24170 [Chitinophagaceae bacterium]|nr:hypothetical protein [Chitinophagaceae bacterium]
MNGDEFYQFLLNRLNTGDVLHTGKNGTQYIFLGWHKGNLQFAGTQTKSIAKDILIAVKDALNNNVAICAEWLRENEMESFASRMALIKSVIKNYSQASTSEMS